jgi:hypothetical protein
MGTNRDLIDFVCPVSVLKCNVKRDYVVSYLTRRCSSEVAKYGRYS